MEEIPFSIEDLNSGRFINDVKPILFVNRYRPRFHEPAVVQSATPPNEDVLFGFGRSFQAAANGCEAKQACQTDA